MVYFRPLGLILIMVNSGLVRVTPVGRVKLFKIN